VGPLNFVYCCYLVNHVTCRMWVVETPSPASTAPPTPTLPHAASPPPISHSPGFSGSTFSPPGTSSLSGIPGIRMSGRLTGVVSLTDILHLFAKSAGLAPEDPSEARRQRRRSSSSSMRASFDQGRGSLDLRELREQRGSFEIRR